MPIYNKIILDADVCIKLGNSEKYTYLEKVLPLLSDKIYLHEVVYDEIKTDKNQIEKLIENETVKILSADNLENIDKKIYESTYQRLKRVIMNPNNEREHKGEVATLAMAKTLSINYFITDEKELQLIIDEQLNNGLEENDIKTIRIEDIVTLIKEEKLSNLKRKDAKLIWIISGKDKSVFDNKIWKKD